MVTFYTLINKQYMWAVTSRKCTVHSFFYNSIILWVTHKDNRNKTTDQYIVKFLRIKKSVL